MIEEEVKALTVGALNAKVEHHRIGAATRIKDDPHIDVVATHGLWEHVVEFVFADHAGAFPEGPKILGRC